MGSIQFKYQNKRELFDTRCTIKLVQSISTAAVSSEYKFGEDQEGCLLRYADAGGKSRERIMFPDELKSKEITKISDLKVFCENQEWTFLSLSPIESLTLDQRGLDSPYIKRYYDANPEKPSKKQSALPDEAETKSKATSSEASQKPNMTTQESSNTPKKPSSTKGKRKKVSSKENTKVAESCPPRQTLKTAKEPSSPKEKGKRPDSNQKGGDSMFSGCVCGCLIIGVLVVFALAFLGATFDIREEDFLANYDVLGLPVTASASEVKKQFYLLSREL